jgi:thiol-disulfide isomerase/thioredoxin
MNLWLPIVVLLLASAFGFYWRSQQGKLKLNKSAESANNDLNSLINQELGKNVTLLQFSSSFCSPCKATAQIISHLVADMDDVVYIQVASEENLKLVEKFDIKSTPTVIFFNRDGIEVGRAVGVPTKEQVLISINTVRTPSDDVGL